MEKIGEYLKVINDNMFIVMVLMIFAIGSVMGIVGIIKLIVKFIRNKK